MIVLTPLTQFRMGGNPPPPTGFSPVTFRKDRISTLNFLTFSFNFFCHTGVKCQGYTLCKSQIIEFKPNLPLKKVVLLVKSLQN